MLIARGSQRRQGGSLYRSGAESVVGRCGGRRGSGDVGAEE